MNIVLEYDPKERTVRIKENDFTTFEAFGVLEAAKQMISHGWLYIEQEGDM